MNAVLVGPGLAVGIIEDVSEVELIVLVHVHVEAEHGRAIAPEASGLRENAALHHHAHRHVRAVEHRQLLQLLSLSVNRLVVLDSLHRVHLHVGVQRWLLRTHCQ